MRHLLLFALCAIAGLARAQTPPTLAVVIVDTVGVPLEGAVVTAAPSPPSSAPLVTDAAGRACCLPAAPDLDSLLIQHLSFGAVAVAPPYTLVGDSLLVVVLAGRSVELASATVLGRYSGMIISGDTIRFDAQRFADGRERDVADLLRQLPGIQVDDDGKVTYLGKTVERLLLNGQDVLRSQFSALNALIGSAEVTTAEVVTERISPGAAETQTLNLNTKKGKALRADVRLGPTSRLDGVAGATALYSPPEGWQLFGTLGYDGSGRAAISSQDAQKQYDWGLMSARGETNLATNTIYFISGVDLSQQAARRDHYAAQANATRTYGDRKTTFFARYIRADEVERGTEELFDARTGDTLGILARERDVVRESAMLTFAHADTSVADLSLDFYGGLQLDAADVTSLGVNRFASPDSAPGAAGGAYAFRQNLPRLSPYLTGVAKYELSERWRARLTADYQGTRETGGWGFGDSYDIFGIAGLRERPQRYPLDFDTRRVTDRLLTDARVSYGTDSLSVAIVGQYSQRTWREQLNSEPDSRFDSPRRLLQYEDTYTAAVKPEWELGQYTLDGTAGASYLTYDRAGASDSRVAPLLMASVSRDFGEAISLHVSGSRATTGFDPERYWQTIRPADTRSYTDGAQLRAPFSTATSASAYLSWRDPERGFNLSLIPALSATDASLSYLPRVAEGYVVYEPVLAFDERRRSINVYGGYNKKALRLNMGGNVNASRSTIDPADPTDYRQVSSSLYLSGSYKPKKWLEFTPGYYLSNSSQTTTPRGDRATSTRLTFHRPRLGVSLRGKQLNVRTSAGVSYGAGVPTLYTLDFSAKYTHPRQPLEFTLTANDILNYNQSTFRDLELSPGNLRATTYERIPGFVSLVGKYTWGRAD